MSTQATHFIQTLLRPGVLARRVAWRLERKAALGLLIILITASLVGWLFLTQASYFTTTSFRIEKLRMDLTTVQRQSAELELEIADKESLPEIEQRARELGFQPPSQVIYLPVPSYPAASQTDPTHSASAR